MTFEKSLLLLILLFLATFTYAQVREDDEETIEYLADTISVHVKSCGCPKIDSLVDFAIAKRHSRYKYGTAGPSTFDCSGFMYYTFKHFGITLSRSSKEQYLMGKKVPNSEISKGDLVFFKRGKGVGHVGLVIQRDSDGTYKFIHASNAKNGIRIDVSTRAGYSNTFVGARRMLDCETNKLFAHNPAPAPQHATTAPPSVIDSTALYRSRAPVVKPAGTTSPTPKPPAAKPNPIPILYTVRAGDTLSAIGRRYGVTADNLKKWNYLTSDKLQVGQKLKIIK